MNQTVKGAAVPVVLVVVGVAVVAAVGGFVGGVIYANRNKGGLGEGTLLEAMTESEQETIPEYVEMIPETTESTTEPATSQLNAIEVIVSGNAYIYNATILTLDELSGILIVNPDLPVLIQDDNASLKAYNDLTDKLDELKIQYSSQN